MGLHVKVGPPAIQKKVTEAPTQFKHKSRGKKHAPYPSVSIMYGLKKKNATQASTAPLLDKKGKRFIQQMCRLFLFLGHVVNNILLYLVSATAL